MTDRQKLVEKVEYFYTDIIEGYKEVELQILRESKLLTMFKKVNYDERIRLFKKYKKQALLLETKNMDIDKGDDESQDLKERLERCLAMFNSLCDAHITMQEFLKKKAQPKSGVKMSDYKKIVELVRNRNMAMQTALHDLDVIYAEYVEEDDEE